MNDYVYPPVVSAAMTLFKALDVDFKLEGMDNIPSSGGAVLASNHISYMDFIFVGATAWWQCKRLTRFMAKQSVFKNGVSGPLMRGMHHIPVDRAAGAESLQVAQSYLERGELVGMFPEATISQSFRVKPMKSGVIRMAAAAGVPVIPMAVWGTQRFWTKNQRRHLFRGHTVSMSIGSPITARAEDVDGQTAALERIVQGLLDDIQVAHPDAQNPPPGAWWLPRHLGGTAPTPEQAAVWDAAEKAARRSR